MSFLKSPDALLIRKNSVKNMCLLFSEDKTKSQLQPPPPSVPASSSNSSSTESLKQSDSINDDDTPWRRTTTRIKVEDTTPKIRKFVWNRVCYERGFYFKAGIREY